MLVFPSLLAFTASAMPTLSDYWLHTCCSSTWFWGMSFDKNVCCRQNHNTLHFIAWLYAVLAPPKKHIIGTMCPAIQTFSIGNLIKITKNTNYWTMFQALVSEILGCSKLAVPIIKSFCFLMLQDMNEYVEYLWLLMRLCGGNGSMSWTHLALEADQPHRKLAVILFCP